MDAWIVWLALGILCFIVEIFTPGFFFFSFGAGAILTGLAAYFTDNLVIQLAVYAISTFFAFILMKRFAKSILKNDTTESNIFALKGKTGIVTKAIPKNGRGYVKIGGEEWSAVFNLNMDMIEEGTQVTIVETEGNKVIVKPKEEK
ncbi:MAG TPA: NfeD family protein [Candidatus Cloacimonadota bacterium]|nr:NfeD family protein [Candidatus Cloacimonadota bacterium]